MRPGRSGNRGGKPLPLSERSSEARPRPRSSGLTNPSRSLALPCSPCCEGAGGHSGCPQPSAVGDDPEGNEPPQGDKQPAGQSHDPHAPHAALPTAEAGLEPLTQRALGLIPQPPPGELDQHAAHVPVAGLADALLPLSAVTGIGSGGQADQGAGFPPIAEL